MKKLNLLTLSLLAASMSAVAGCNSNKYTIGVLLPVEHKALQLAESGFIKGLEQSGLKKDQDFAINEKNAGGDEAALQTLAKDLVVSSSMTLGVGTGASKSLLSAAKDNGKTNPILFTAVTDPVDAKLVASEENGSGFVTGASDKQPVLLQISLIKEVLPSADKIGIIYTSSEENSVVQADQAESIAKSLMMDVVRKTVSGPSDISAVATALATTEGLDAIYVPTDNNIAANMNAIKEACNANNVLAMCGEFGEVETGGHISFSFDYETLGVETGKLAAKIIKGEAEAKDLPVAFMALEQCTIKYSSANLAGTSIEIPASVLEKATDLSK